MKKFAFAVIVFVCGAYAASAYILGGQARELYFSALKEYERYGFMSLSNQGYERGFFTSHAQTRVELRIPDESQETDGDVARFVVKHVIHHGPLTGQGGDFFRPGLARITSSVEPVAGDGGSGEFFASFPELAGTASEVQVAFNGRVAGDVRVPAIDRSIDGEHVAWGGLDLRVEYVPSTRALSGQVNMPSLVVKAGEGSTELTALTGVFDLVEALPLVYAGHVEAGISSMDVLPAEGEDVRVRNLRLTSNSTCDGSLYHFVQNIALESVGVGSSTYGPASCELTGKNLNATALSEFQISVQNLYRNMSDTDSEAFFDQVGQLYAELFAKILAGKPELGMPHLRVITPLGDLTGAFSVKLLSPAGEAGLNPLLLLQHLEAGAEMAVHEELLKGMLRLGMEEESDGQDLEEIVRQRYAERIDPLVAQNLLVREGGIVSGKALYSNGRLTVNGKDMPLF